VRRSAFRSAARWANGPYTNTPMLLRAAVRQYLVLDLATEQVVRRLQSPQPKAVAENSGHLRGRFVVGQRRRWADLAVEDQFAQAPPRRSRRAGTAGVGPNAPGTGRCDRLPQRPVRLASTPRRNHARARVADQAGISLAQTAFGGNNEFTAPRLASSSRSALPRICSERAETVRPAAVSKKLTAQFAGTADRGVMAAVFVENDPSPHRAARCRRRWRENVEPPFAPKSWSSNRSPIRFEHKSYYRVGLSTTIARPAKPVSPTADPNRGPPPLAGI